MWDPLWTRVETSVSFGSNSGGAPRGVAEAAGRIALIMLINAMSENVILTMLLAEADLVKTKLRLMVERKDEELWEEVWEEG